MKKNTTEFSPGRREAMKMIALGSTAGFLGLLGSSGTQAQEQRPSPNYKNGLPPLKIRSVKAIATAPEGINLVVVKVETTYQQKNTRE